MTLFKRKYNVDYSLLISELGKGDEKAIQNLLWQSKKKTVKYLPITTVMIQKFKNLENSTNNLRIYKKKDKGRFELIIFEVPWIKSEVPYSPIIIDKANSKIVGIMLPFNELHNHLSKKEIKNIGILGLEWTGFVLKYRLIL